ncbi:MAG TPA: alpha-glucan family phosphorylase [Vicinamibacterales bacterium]|nr:alpha-glucan family phosphorylase [Vicinamibacterales bacterium]
MPVVAYFSMEIGVLAEMPTYAGGLGVLAGDTLRSAADIGVSMIGVTLLHRKGYFHQRLDSAGQQTESPDSWNVSQFLIEQPARAAVTIEGRQVRLRCWRYVVTGTEGEVPIYFLDADLPDNAEADRALTDVLYGGDERYRLCQEIVLGIGGVRILRALGYQQIDRFHMNEGHSSLLVMELLQEQARAAGRSVVSSEDVSTVRQRCVFTTHTPVGAGHDQFSMDTVHRVLGDNSVFGLQHLCCHEGRLNLTYLALNFSHYVNGVAMRHGEISRAMFGGYTIDAITNGIHAATWAADEFHALFDRHIPGWRRDNFSLRYALDIPRDAIWQAHSGAKRRMIERIATDTGVTFDANVFTIGFARRATEYKRADLLFLDADRLNHIATAAGPLQIVYSGKAHPRDEAGKQLIERIFTARSAVGPRVMIVYLQNYDMALGKTLTSGVDLWLNTPLPPLEASGTSGMKAALNGVPSLSMLDGWWVEGCIEGVTGWAIGDDNRPPRHDSNAADASSTYDKLEHLILPLFHQNRDGYLDVMRHAIALNGSFFNSHRMLEEYRLKAYAV